MKPQVSEVFAACMGLAWADAQPDVCRQAAGTAQRALLRLAHRPEAMHTWLQPLHTRCHGQPVAVCLALHTGPIVSALRHDDFLGLFPGHALTGAQARDAFPPSRATDAPTDAALQGDILRKHRDTLTPLRPHSPTMRALAPLVAHRRRRIGATGRLRNRLTRALTNSFPQVLHWLPEQATVIFGDFLSRWPTLKAAQLARRTTVAGFFRAHQVRSTDLVATRIEAIKNARALSTADGVIAPTVLLGHARVAQLRGTFQAMTDFDTASAQRAQAHPAFP